MTRPRLLILSFSPLRTDARVLKQIALFSDRYEVTTCGYGPAPDGVAAHFEMPRSADYQDLNGRLITLRWYQAAYWRISAVAWVRRHVPRDSYDVALANETEAVPVALWLRPRGGVHADLHEFTPRLNEELPAWKRRIAPFHRWVCRRYVRRASSWTTVSPGIVRAYQEEFGFVPELVTNAAPLTDLSPSPVDTPIRLVHSGACLRNRRLDVLLDAFAASTADATLDLILTPNHPDFLAELKERAAEIPGARVLDPVPYEELIGRLNTYDVGVHVLPPTNFNNAWALPNKLFEYAQARLGVVVGPSPEMAAYVESLGFGVVTDGFAADDLSAALDALDAESVAGWKAAAHAHAYELSAESQLPVWERAIDALAAEAGGDAR
nr:glycosyltransferase family 1 protein [Microbacterium sp. MF43]